MSDEVDGNAQKFMLKNNYKTLCCVCWEYTARPPGFAKVPDPCGCTVKKATSGLAKEGSSILVLILDGNPYPPFV